MAGASITAESPWGVAGTRDERIAAAIEQHGLSALLALTPENAAYLSGRTSMVATLWRLPGLVAVARDANGSLAVASGDNDIDAYASAAARFAHPLWIEHLDTRGLPGALLPRLQAARPAGALERPAQYDAALMLDAVASAVRAVADGGQVGAELAQLPAWIATGLRDRLPEIALVEATPIFDDLRAIKDRAEIEHLRRATELTEIGITAARDALRPGLSALGVSAAYQQAIWQAAAADDRYAAMRQVEGLVSVGDGGTQALVGPEVMVKLDMQVDVGGYHSDVGRTYALSPNDDQQLIFDALRHALDRAIAAIGPGVPMRDVWAAGTDAMHAAGFASYSRGHLGHSVGLAHHYEEPPFIAPGESRPFAPGMVVSVELPYYLLGIGAFQLERMVLVGDEAAEVLDHLPFQIDPRQ